MWPCMSQPSLPAAVTVSASLCPSPPCPPPPPHRLIWLPVLGRCGHLAEHATSPPLLSHCVLRPRPPQESLRSDLLGAVAGLALLRASPFRCLLHDCPTDCRPCRRGRCRRLCATCAQGRAALGGFRWCSAHGAGTGSAAARSGAGISALHSAAGAPRQVSSAAGTITPDLGRSAASQASSMTRGVVHFVVARGTQALP